MGSESKFKGSHHVYRGHKVAGSYYILVVSGYASAFMTDLKMLNLCFGVSSYVDRIAEGVSLSRLGL